MVVGLGAVEDHGVILIIRVSVSVMVVMTPRQHLQGRDAGCTPWPSPSPLGRMPALEPTNPRNLKTDKCHLVVIDNSETINNNHRHQIIIMSPSFILIHHLEIVTFSLSRFPLVLLGEHIIERPRLQLGDVPQLARLPEVLLRVLAWTEVFIIYGYDSAHVCILQDVLIVLMFLSLTRHGDVPGDVSGELDDVRKVVVVPAVVLATVRLKQVIT